MRFEATQRYRPPLDWQAMLEFFGRRAIAGLEQVSSERYRRTIACDGASGTLEVGPSDGRQAVSLRIELDADRDPEPLVERTRRMLDLDADPLAVEATLRRDPLLAEMVTAHPGLRVPGCWDPFELTVRAVLGQQVTVRGAATLGSRLVRSYGEPIAHGEGALTHAFPTSEALRDADLGEVGLPRKRAETIRALARAVADGRLTLAPGADRQAFSAAITSIPGVGEWTAEYVAMRALGDGDAFPASDLGLLKAAAGRGERPTPRQLVRRAEAWRPWRAYAAVYLWQASA